MDNGRVAMPTGRADPCATIGIEVPVTALRKSNTILKEQIANPLFLRERLSRLRGWEAD